MLVSVCVFCKTLLRLGTVAALVFMATALMAEARADGGKDNTLYLTTKHGRVVIQMRPDLAPNHVARIRTLVREKFYDGVAFHRVIEGFMAQSGDPTGTGSGGSGQNLKAEFSNAPHVRGTVSMARAHHPDSADSQFFIVYAAAPYLDGQYTVWGEVIAGMEYVDAVKKGAAGANGMVDNPDTIISIRLAADVKIGGGLSGGK